MPRFKFVANELVEGGGAKLWLHIGAVHALVEELASFYVIIEAKVKTNPNIS